MIICYSEPRPLRYGTRRPQTKSGQNAPEAAAAEEAGEIELAFGAAAAGDEQSAGGSPIGAAAAAAAAEAAVIAEEASGAAGVFARSTLRLEQQTTR